MLPSMYSAAKGMVGAVPNLEAMGTLGQRYRLYMSGSDTQKRVGKMLFDDREDGASSRELNSLAALTFNVAQCDEIVEMLGLALNPEQSTWKTIFKGLKLADVIVIHGSETGVNAILDFDRSVEHLVSYNSALASRMHGIRGGGQDQGGPVREAAKALAALLGDMDQIRERRAAARDPNTLVPMGTDDYSPQAAMQVPAVAPDRDAFGQVTQSALGARFSLENVPGLYEGRPERYFESEDDPRAGQGRVEDASHTRNALAGDLLDLDFAPTTTSGDALPAPDFLPAQQQNEELQRQLAQMQAQLANFATQPQAAPPSMPGSGMQPQGGLAMHGMPPQAPMMQGGMYGASMPSPQTGYGQQPFAPQGQMNQVGQSHMGQSGHAGNMGQVGQMGQMCQMGYMGQMGSMGQTGQMGQMGQMGYGARSTSSGSAQGAPAPSVHPPGGQNGYSGGQMDHQMQQLQMLQAQQRALQQQLAMSQSQGRPMQNGFMS